MSSVGGTGGYRNDRYFWEMETLLGPMSMGSAGTYHSYDVRTRNWRRYEEDQWNQWQDTSTKYVQLVAPRYYTGEWVKRHGMHQWHASEQDYANDFKAFAKAFGPVLSMATHSFNHADWIAAVGSMILGNIPIVGTGASILFQTLFPQLIGNKVTQVWNAPGKDVAALESLYINFLEDGFWYRGQLTEGGRAALWIMAEPEEYKRWLDEQKKIYKDAAPSSNPRSLQWAVQNNSKEWLLPHAVTALRDRFRQIEQVAKREANNALQLFVQRRQGAFDTAFATREQMKKTHSEMHNALYEMYALLEKHDRERRFNPGLAATVPTHLVNLTIPSILRFAPNSVKQLDPSIRLYDYLDALQRGDFQKAWQVMPRIGTQDSGHWGPREYVRQSGIAPWTLRAMDDYIWYHMLPGNVVYNYNPDGSKTGVVYSQYPDKDRARLELALRFLQIADSNDWNAVDMRWMNFTDAAKNYDSRVFDWGMGPHGDYRWWNTPQVYGYNYDTWTEMFMAELQKEFTAVATPLYKQTVEALENVKDRVTNNYYTPGAQFTADQLAQMQRQMDQWKPVRTTNGPMPAVAPTMPAPAVNTGTSAPAVTSPTSAPAVNAF